MKKEKKATKKSLLVLGAMATLSGQLAPELAILAYATPQVNQQQSSYTNMIEQRKLVAIQNDAVASRYQLVELVQQEIPTVRIEKGAVGETIKQSFVLTKEETGHLNFNLTLAGPTDSQVVVKINGVTYLEQTVGRGQLAEASFFALDEGEALVEVEYTVGQGEVVLDSQPWLEFSQMILTTKEKPSTSLEYRVKGQTDWVTYQHSEGIETTINSKEDNLPLELRYVGQEEIFDLTIEAPNPHLPLLLLEENGLFYLNQFNTNVNRNETLKVRFNGGEWQTYSPGMKLDWVNNKCSVEVKVTNNYGVEKILPIQHYELTPLSQPVLKQEGNLITLSLNNLDHLNPAIEYQIDGGEWLSYSQPFTPDFEEESIQLKVRVSDVYGRSLETVFNNIQSQGALDTSVGTLDSQASVIKPSISSVSHIYGLYKTHEDIRLAVSTQANGGSKVTTTEWSTDGVTWNKFSYNIDLKFTTAGDYTLLVRATNTDGVVSDVYQQQLTITEAVAPIIEELNFLESELYVGGEYEPHWKIKHDEGTRLNRLEWGGDYDTMFDTPGEKTITLRAQDTRGLWSDEVSYTFTVLPANKPVVQNLRLEETDIIVGEQYEFKYDIIQDENTQIVDVFWSGDYDTAFDTPGEKTVTLEVMDNRGIWSEVASYTFTVREAKAPIIKESNTATNEFVEGEEIKLNYEVQYDTNANYQNIEWLSGYPLSNKPGTHQATFRIQDSRGLWSAPYTITYVVKTKEVAPTLTFESDTLKVPYGSTLSSIYKKGVTINAGTATNVKYSAFQDTFNPNKIGKQEVKYLIKYTENGVEKRAYAYRTIEVTAVDPTMKFSTLKVKYGSDLNYKSGVTLSNGSATNVKYTLVENSYNPKKLGKQTVKYQLTYKQNGKTVKKTVNRTIEVTAVDPTLKFSNSTLKVKYGSDLNYKSGVTLSKGSATDVKYSLVKNSYNSKKLGKQTVKYQLTYKQNGKTVKKTINRTIEVTAVNPTLTFPKTTLTVKYGQTPNFTSGVKLNKGSATNVKYSVVKSSFNAKKRGTQKVKYQINYKQNGKSYKTTVTRNVVVK